MNLRDCQCEQIASYLDDEMDETTLQQFEAHLKVCEQCTSELAEQRRLLGTLQSVLIDGSELSLPINFAHVVAVTAESDMHGVRARREHRRALMVCAILAVTSFAFLGVAARSYLVSFARAISRPVSLVFDLVWTTAYDVVTGLIVISRVISKGVVPESQLVGLLAFFLLALAVLLLSRLIAGYQRVTD